MEIKLDLVALLGSFILVISWFSRLEFMSKQNQKDIAENNFRLDGFSKEFRDKHDLLSQELREEVRHMSNTLARIEGKLSIQNKDHSL